MMERDKRGCLKLSVVSGENAVGGLLPPPICLGEICHLLLLLTPLTAPPLSLSGSPRPLGEEALHPIRSIAPSDGCAE